MEAKELVRGPRTDQTAPLSLPFLSDAARSSDLVDLVWRVAPPDSASQVFQLPATLCVQREAGTQMGRTVLHHCVRPCVV